MSVCVQTEDDSASEEPPGGGPVRELYEQKAASTVVRVLTVLAYLLSVSLAAILLSVYYVCVWKSPELPPANETQGQMSRQRGHPGDYHLNRTHGSFDSGGGNTTVSDDVNSSPPTTTNDTAEPTDPYPAQTSTQSLLAEYSVTTDEPYGGTTDDTGASETTT